ncbi:uncharacterized protein LOC103361860 [Stegastes partitus]|uniref:Uncharacterized LOC103361860 n=1 Tax=Stegastes partitus TaxID=144197 RepID=A0A3B5APX0_9TELE|nr:PREDICTED: uncharacterized protein LOC103361860 [Stegastes partitus]
MMRVSGRVPVCCIALILVLTSASAVPRLKSISDLKTIGSGQSGHNAALVLLHWFATTVTIDNNNVIRLSFDPDSRHYGSHHYGNYEGILEPLPLSNARYRYFTVGNINQQDSLELPSYVVLFQREGGNRNRIIIRVREENVGSTIDQVYTTQHYETSEHQGTRYDPDHTYRLTVNLLRQIREFPVDDNRMNSMTNLRNRFGSSVDDSQLRLIRDTWGSLACLGLLLFIVIQEKHSPAQRNHRPPPAARRNTDFVVNIPENRQNGRSETFAGLHMGQSNGVTLKVTTGPGGKARIVWRKVPQHLLRQGMMVALYKNGEDEEVMASKSIGNSESGSHDTCVPLNDGLQVRLHEVRTVYCFWSRRGEETCRGPEFHNPTAVNITEYSAKLQLFVKDGKACARLYVHKAFSEWKTDFRKSWVGFYSSAQKATSDYEWWQWQWATKFKVNPDFEDPSYDIYEYHSGMAVATGVQARFMLQGELEKARTLTWGA